MKTTVEQARGWSYFIEFCPTIYWYGKTSNKRPGSNKSRSLIGAGCTGTLNLKNASNYIPLINACLQLQPGLRYLKFIAARALIRSFAICCFWCCSIVLWFVLYIIPIICKLTLRCSTRCNKRPVDCHSQYHNPQSALHHHWIAFGISSCGIPPVRRLV